MLLVVSRWRRNQWLELRDKLGHPFRRDPPDPLELDIAVFVADHISLCNDAGPGDFRMERLELAGYPIGRHPDDLQLSLHCEAQHSVREKILITLAGEKLLDLAAGLNHIPEVG